MGGGVVQNGSDWNGESNAESKTEGANGGSSHPWSEAFLVVTGWRCLKKALLLGPKIRLPS
jgi:hypothetical protein